MCVKFAWVTYSHQWIGIALCRQNKGVTVSERIELHDQTELECEYLECFLETRCVPQNLFYLLGGATSFAYYRNRDLMQIAWENEARFLESELSLIEDDLWAFISLGCGNAGPDVSLLHHLVERRDGWHYYGVDSSAAMLNLAEANLEALACASHVVLADFCRDDFSQALDQLLAVYDRRLFAMMGGTFGNFDQRWIADLLEILIPAGDYLYLDVVPQYPSDDANASLRERLAHLPDNLNRFFVDLLERLEIPMEQGRLISDEHPDEGLNTLRFTFSFEATEPTTLQYSQGELDLLPGERVELLTIRAYDVDRLTTFMARHGFDLQGTYIPKASGLKHLWQRLLFKKV
jgi:hypothetical protein